MFPTVDFEVDQLKAGLSRLLDVSSRGLVEVVNQSMLNIGGRALALLSPADVKGKRREIKAYMQRPVQAYTKNGAAVRRPVKLVYLIVNARFRKKGWPGAYGDLMKSRSGQLQGHAQTSVGFLKSLFLPVIRALQPRCKFKVPFNLTRNIARWPDSAGSYTVKACDPGSAASNLLTGSFSVGANLKSPVSSQAERRVEAALRQAILDETASIERHVASKILKASKEEGAVIPGGVPEEREAVYASAA